MRTLSPQQFSTLFTAASGSGARRRLQLQPIPLLPLTPTNRIKLNLRGTFTLTLPSPAPSSPSIRLSSPTSLVKPAFSAAFRTLDLQQDCTGLLPCRVLSLIFTKALPRPCLLRRRRLLVTRARPPLPAPQPQIPPKHRPKGRMRSPRPGTNERGNSSPARHFRALIFAVLCKAVLCIRDNSPIFCRIDSSVPKHLQYFT